MNKTKKKYKTKCKKRQIVFYKKDNEIYEISKSINFQKFVKLCLKYINACDTAIMYEKMEEGDDNGKKDL